MTITYTSTDPVAFSKLAKIHNVMRSANARNLSVMTPSATQPPGSICSVVSTLLEYSWLLYTLLHYELMLSGSKFSLSVAEPGELWGYVLVLAIISVHVYVKIMHTTGQVFIV